MQYPPHPNNQQPPQPGQSWQPQQYPAPSNAYYPPQQFQRPMPLPLIAPPPPPKKKSRKRLWIGLAILASALVLCIAVSVAAANTPTPPPAAVTAKPTATTASTQAPTATATPRPKPKPTTVITTNSTITHGTPRLGGPLSDFVGKYGQPNNHTDASSSHWFRDTSSNADGLIVWRLTHPQVDSIVIAPVDGAVWTSSTAQANCTVYNPSDARELKRVSLVDASGQTSGFDVIYVSASLAQEFAAGDFTDANGNTTQRGSFDIQYLYKSDGTQNIDSCSIQLGEQQTHL